MAGVAGETVCCTGTGAGTTVCLPEGLLKIPPARTAPMITTTRSRNAATTRGSRGFFWGTFVTGSSVTGGLEQTGCRYGLSGSAG